ncbi:hypothetical protein PNOK_0012400 [Pyrrhoderma noxium]|uniref:Uncharacterized protein n=1 Tax=Pyrrhoderma noxium TaxID=2282107 RepID=A0A286UU06_9AGAM|nr:hypothetical protein PNOK_0012400 [Pyrrhoderma noxium]
MKIESSKLTASKSKHNKHQQGAKNDLNFVIETGKTYRPFTDPYRIKVNDEKKESGTISKARVRGVPDKYLNVMVTDKPREKLKHRPVKTRPKKTNERIYPSDEDPSYDISLTKLHHSLPDLHLSRTSSTSSLDSIFESDSYSDSSDLFTQKFAKQEPTEASQTLDGFPESSISDISFLPNFDTSTEYTSFHDVDGLGTFSDYGAINTMSTLPPDYGMKSNYVSSDAGCFYSDPLIIRDGANMYLASDGWM